MSIDEATDRLSIDAQGAATNTPAGESTPNPPNCPARPTAQLPRTREGGGVDRQSGLTSVDRHLSWQEGAQTKSNQQQPIQMEGLSTEVRGIVEQLACPVCYEAKHLVLCCEEGHPLCLDCKPRMRACGICRNPFLPTCPPCRPVNALIDSFGIAPPPRPVVAAVVRPAPRPLRPPPRQHAARTGEVRHLGAKLNRLFKRLNCDERILGGIPAGNLSMVGKYQRRINKTLEEISDTEVSYIQRHGRAYRGRRGARA